MEEKDFWGSEVGGPVVKSEMFITMGMWGEKITFIFKEKTFFFLRVTAGKLVEYGGGEGTGINYEKMKCKLKR